MGHPAPQSDRPHRSESNRPFLRTGASEPLIVPESTQLVDSTRSVQFEPILIDAINDLFQDSNMVDHDAFVTGIFQILTLLDEQQKLLTASREILHRPFVDKVHKLVKDFASTGTFDPTTPLLIEVERAAGHTTFRMYAVPAVVLLERALVRFGSEPIGFTDQTPSAQKVVDLLPQYLERTYKAFLRHRPADVGFAPPSIGR